MRRLACAIGAVALGAKVANYLSGEVETVSPAALVLCGGHMQTQIRLEYARMLQLAAAAVVGLASGRPEYRGVWASRLVTARVVIIVGLVYSNI